VLRRLPMCMKRTGKVRVATKDIVVWKVFEEHWKGLLTPFMLEESTKIFNKRASGFAKGYGIHTYAKKRDAEVLAKSGIIFRGKVVKCFIPKGAKYVKGIDTTTASTEGLPCYQSTHLKEFK